MVTEEKELKHSLQLCNLVDIKFLCDVIHNMFNMFNFTSDVKFLVFAL